MVRRGFLVASALTLALAANLQAGGFLQLIPEAFAIPATRTFTSAWDIREFIKTIPGITHIPGPIPDYMSGAPRNDQVTANAICAFAGYQTAQITNYSSYHSCGDNTIGYWNGSDFVIYGACNFNNFIHGLVCSNPYRCQDGLDNDGDGLIDYPQDPGCANATDNDESNPNADMVLSNSPTGGSVIRGTAAAFAATVRNNGTSTASNVVLTQSIPPGTTYAGSTVPSNMSCGQQGTNVVCQLGNFGAGSQVVFTLYFETSATATCGSTVTTNGSVTTTTPESSTSNNIAAGGATVTCPTAMAPICPLTANAFATSIQALSQVAINSPNDVLGPNNFTVADFDGVNATTQGFVTVNFAAPITNVVGDDFAIYLNDFFTGEPVELFEVLVQNGNGTPVSLGVRSPTQTVAGQEQRLTFDIASTGLPQATRVTVRNINVSANPHVGPDIDAFENISVCGTPIVQSQCQNGIDDDGDGLVDMIDPGCSSPSDTNESDDACVAANVLVYSLQPAGSSPAYESENSTITQQLRNQGFTVTFRNRQAQPTITQSFLSQYNVVWFFNGCGGATGIPSSAELNAIRDYYLAGGNLILTVDDDAGDSSAIGSCQNRVNAISTNLGVQFSGHPYHGTPDLSAGICQPVSPSHPLFNNAAKVFRYSDALLSFTNSVNWGSTLPVSAGTLTVDGQNALAVTPAAGGHGKVIFDPAYGSFSATCNTGQQLVRNAFGFFGFKAICAGNPQCNDGIDNDGDGATDTADFSCSGPTDNDETNPRAACQDNADNDGDGLIDFPLDLGCSSRQDNDESGGGSGGASCSEGSQILGSIYSNINGSTDFFTLNQSRTSAYCSGTDLLLAGAGTGPSCDNSSSPACNLQMHYEFNSFTALGSQLGWTANYSVPGDAFYDTVRAEARCVPNTAVTTKYFSTYVRTSGAISDYYGLNQNKTVAYCDPGDTAIHGGGTNVFCDGPGNGGCGIQMLEFNGRIIDGNREGWKTDYSMPGDAIYDTIQTTVVCLKKTSLFDQALRVYHVVNEANPVDYYSLNQSRTEALCNAGDIVIGGGGNPAYCDSGANPACSRIQYLEYNHSVAVGGRQGWRASFDLGGDAIYDTQRVAATCLGLANSCSGSTPQCSDNADNDGDNLIDTNDPGCHTDFNRFNAASYNPNGTSEASNSGRGTCADGIDNNGNAQIDAQDPVCHTDGNPSNAASFDSTRNETGGGNGTCSQAFFIAQSGTLAAQGWTALTPGANQSVTGPTTENGVTYIRIADNSTASGLRTEYPSIPDSALADRDWTLDMMARIISSNPNGYVVGMNMLLTSPAGKYASIYIDTTKFGPLGPSLTQYEYARSVNRTTTDGFHLYRISYHKNGSGVNDDTFDILFDNQVVIAGVTRNELWNSGAAGQNINGLSFGIGSSPGTGTMDVSYVSFRNTDSFCPLLSQCQDGLDNDGDGKIDFPQDGGCSSLTDNDESGGGSTTPQCADGSDNDGDQLIDISDPGCHTDFNRFNAASYNPNGTSEASNSGRGTCADGIDNNGNVFIDAFDAVCHTDGNVANAASFDPNRNESGTGGNTQCSDNADNDGDNLIDTNDPGCHTDFNRFNAASYNPNGTSEASNSGRGTCADGIDNNGNAQIDAQDPICHTDGNPSNAASFDSTRNETGGGSGGGNADLSITLTGPSTITKGGTAIYTSTIVNSGPNTATNITVTDPPPGFTFLPAQSSTGCSQVGNTVQCTLASLVSGGSQTFTLAFSTQQSSCNISVTNIATVTSGNPDPNSSNNQSQSVVTTVNCSGTGAQCQDGQDNDGDGLIDNADPDCHTDGNAQNAASYDGSRSETTNNSSQQCRNGRDDDGDGLIDALDPDCHTDGNASNTSSYDGNRTENSGGGNDACLDISVEDDRDPAEPGDTVEYEITVENDCSTSRTFTLRAVLDNDMDFEDASGNGDDVSNNEVQWQNVTIAAGDDKDFTLEVDLDDDLDDGDEVELNVFAGSKNEDETTDIEEDIGSTGGSFGGSTGGTNTVQLSVTKSADRSTAQPGDTVVYTIAVRNSGGRSAQNVIIEDQFNSGQLSILDPAGGSANGSTLRWTLDRVDANTTRTLRYTARISGSMRHGDTVQNSVRVNGDTSTANDSNMIRIVQQLPQTGIGRITGGTTPAVPTLSARSSQDGSLAAIAGWIATMAGGLSLGGALGRKFLLKV